MARCVKSKAYVSSKYVAKVESSLPERRPRSIS